MFPEWQGHVDRFQVAKDDDEIVVAVYDCKTGETKGSCLGEARVQIHSLIPGEYTAWHPLVSETEGLPIEGSTVELTIKVVPFLPLPAGVLTVSVNCAFGLPLRRSIKEKFEGDRLGSLGEGESNVKAEGRFGHKNSPVARCRMHGHATAAAAAAKANRAFPLSHDAIVEIGGGDGKMHNTYARVKIESRTASGGRTEGELQDASDMIEVGRTRIIMASRMPAWEETFDVDVSDITTAVAIEVVSAGNMRSRSDMSLGEVVIEVNSLAAVCIGKNLDSVVFPMRLSRDTRRAAVVTGKLDSLQVTGSISVSIAFSPATPVPRGLLTVEILEATNLFPDGQPIAKPPPPPERKPSLIAGRVAGRVTSRPGRTVGKFAGNHGTGSFGSSASSSSKTRTRTPFAVVGRVYVYDRRVPRGRQDALAGQTGISHSSSPTWDAANGSSITKDVSSTHRDVIIEVAEVSHKIRSGNKMPHVSLGQYVVPMFALVEAGVEGIEGVFPLERIHPGAIGGGQVSAHLKFRPLIDSTPLGTLAVRIAAARGMRHLSETWCRVSVRRFNTEGPDFVYMGETGVAALAPSTEDNGDITLYDAGDVGESDDLDMTAREVTLNGKIIEHTCGETDLSVLVEVLTRDGNDSGTIDVVGIAEMPIANAVNVAKQSETPKKQGETGHSDKLADAYASAAASTSTPPQDLPHTPNIEPLWIDLECPRGQGSSLLFKRGLQVCLGLAFTPWHDRPSALCEVVVVEARRFVPPPLLLSSYAAVHVVSRFGRSTSLGTTRVISESRRPVFGKPREANISGNNTKEDVICALRAGSDDVDDELNTFSWQMDRFDRGVIVELRSVSAMALNPRAPINSEQSVVIGSVDIDLGPCERGWIDQWFPMAAPNGEVSGEVRVEIGLHAHRIRPRPGRVVGDPPSPRVCAIDKYDHVEQDELNDSADNQERYNKNTIPQDARRRSAPPVEKVDERKSDVRMPNGSKLQTKEPTKITQSDVRDPMGKQTPVQTTPAQNASFSSRGSSESENTDSDKETPLAAEAEGNDESDALSNEDDISLDRPKSRKKPTKQQKHRRRSRIEGDFVATDEVTYIEKDSAEDDDQDVSDTAADDQGRIEEVDDESLYTPDFRPLLSMPKEDEASAGALQKLFDSKKISDVEVDISGRNVTGPILEDLIFSGTLVKDKVKTMVLDNNNLGPQGAAVLRKFLAQNRALRLLSIKNCRLGDAGLVALVAGPPNGAFGVEELLLGDNGLTDGCAAALHSVVERFSSIVRLSVACNPKLTAVALKPVASTPSSLHDLLFAACNVTDDEEDAILEALRNKPGQQPVDVGRDAADIQQSTNSDASNE